MTVHRNIETSLSQSPQGNINNELIKGNVAHSKDMESPAPHNMMVSTDARFFTELPLRALAVQLKPRIPDCPQT